MPWKLIAVVLTVAIPVGPVMLIGRGLSLSTALRPALLVLMGAVLAWSMARRQQQPQIERFDGPATGEGAVLYLRSFRSERRPFAQTDAAAGRGWIHRRLALLWSDPNEEFLTFERYLGEPLQRRVGPVIGLGATTDHLPPESPVRRHYASDPGANGTEPDWEQVIRELVPAVRCCVMPVDLFDKLEFELNCVRAPPSSPSKLFVVTPPYGRDPAPRAPLRVRFAHLLSRYREPDWAEVVTVFGNAEYMLPTDHPGAGCVLTFDAQGVAEVLVTGARTAEDYVGAIAGRVRLS